MRFDRQLEVCIVSLLFTAASLTFSNAEVKGHAEGQENPCHPESLVSPKSKSCLEEELKELRDSVDANRQLIDSLEKRGEHVKDGQPEFADSDLHTTVTESHPVEAVEEVDDLTDVRRYSTTTLRTVDVEEPVMEDTGDDDDADDDDGDDEEAEDVEETGGRPVPQKRSGGDDDDDDEDSDEEDDDDDDDDEDDDEDDGDGEMRRKKKNGMEEVETSTASATSTSIETSSGSTTAETSTPSIEGETTTPGVATTTRDALLSRFDAFLERDKKSGARSQEADFEGVGKLKQIREIDKRVDQKLKEKYINAVEPHADEQLLELMVKIAENPRDWNAVHAMLQQLDEDIAVVQQIENEAKNLENKRDDNGVETKSKTRKLTKEERKQQQADKKKKKKKKKQRQKEKLAREQKLREEEEDKSRLAVETLRRQQLERAGLLNSAGRTMKDQGRQVKPSTPKTTKPTPTPTPTPASTTTTTSTTTSTTTVPSVATTWLPKELQGASKLQPHGSSNQMKTLDSAIDVLSKDHARIVLNPAQWPRPKSPMQEVREKWPKALSNLERPINTAKAIVTGRLRPSADDYDRPRTTSESNEWSKADIASAAAEDKERARERFLKETVYAKNNVVHWKPNAKAKWLETIPLPSKEHRANSHNTYFNGKPSIKQPDNGWPDFSLNALKHGNIDTTNEEVVIAEQSGQDVWPNLPVDADRDWPDFTSNTIDADRVNGWNRKQQAMSNTWPGISHSKALEHAKEVAGSKQWPHFAYHRVTSSPLQSRQRQQQEAQQRARHRNAYIAVSIISPPKNRSAARNATAAATATAKEATVNETRQLPDKMDELLDQRSEQSRKLTPVDPLEEQLIDMAASGTDPRSKFNWSHSRHLDKIQEQLKTLSAMEAKLQAQWLEKERLRQILRDGGKSGSYYRDVRSDSQRAAAGAAGAAGAGAAGAASSFDTDQTSDA